MKVEKKHFFKANGMQWLIFSFLMAAKLCFSSENPEAYQPTPIGSVFIRLAQRPTPVSLSISPIAIQAAQVNSNFMLNLNPYIRLAPSEFSYQVTNAFINTETAYLLATINGIHGLPSGLSQINNRAGDCSPVFSIGTQQSCMLHFYSNNDRYFSENEAFGPALSMIVTWRWGDKKRRGGGVNVTAQPLASQTIAAVLSPMLMPINTNVKPAMQDGLHFDPKTMSILGTPTRVGIYRFTVEASNGYASAMPRELIINVGINPKDTPVFRTNYSIASVMSNHHYHLSLLDFLESKPGFMVTNQVNFRIDSNYPHPDWLSINPKNAVFLEGYAPQLDGVYEHNVTLIASSNTGGDSLPITLSIPVALNLANKPIIEKGISLTRQFGASIHHNFQENIIDPIADGSLKVIIDEIAPAAPWLSISPSNPSELIGVIPEKAIGQQYQITLHANTREGGNSDTSIISLTIEPMQDIA